MTKVLVVDDEHAIIDLLSRFLEEEGYQVITAGNGEEGMTRLQISRPDVVLCDLMMPVLNGREMCRKMQADPRYRSIPFVLMSAVIRAVNFTDCHYSALLAKPFDLEDVLNMVTRLSKSA